MFRKVVIGNILCYDIMRFHMLIFCGFWKGVCGYKRGFEIEKGKSMEKFLIVCPFLFLSGFVDAIAGGGGLISFPAFVLAGVPVHIIIGTSKLGAFPGAIVAMLRFAKSGFVKWKLAIPCGKARAY